MLSCIKFCKNNFSFLEKQHRRLACKLILQKDYKEKKTLANNQNACIPTKLIIGKIIIPTGE